MTHASFEPVARKEYQDRLELLPPNSESKSELWNQVHDEFQEQLAPLETAIRQKIDGVRVEPGRTRGEKFFLFSYRTFSIPGSAIEPVVVGLTFTPTHSGVIVEADASGERTGDIISSMPGETLAGERDELLAAARKSAEKLFQSADAIAAALQNASRRFE